MPHILNYIFEVSITMSLLFIVWTLFLKKETFHNIQRYFLLFIPILSFIIPALSIDIKTGNTSILRNYMISPIQLDEVIINSEANSFYIHDWLVLLYFAGIIFLFIRFLVRLNQIRKFANNCDQIIYKGRKILVTDKEISAFSFFNTIFFNKEDINRKDFNEIFTHELVHVKQKHSIDIILTEFAIIFQWFNPLIYIIKKQLVTLHEYLSDEKVILQGFESDKYQMLLINQQIGTQFEFANYFNKSLTLKRINMINKTKSNHRAKLKVLWALPALLITFMFFSFSGNNRIADNTPANHPQDTIYLEVDEMAQFKGGDIGIRNFLAENMKYPEEARKNKEEGSVFVKFVVDKTGKVGNAIIVKGVSESLDKEALRVISTLPDFEKPGYKDGKAVDLYYSIPLTFRLK